MKRTQLKTQLCVALLCLGSISYGQNVNNIYAANTVNQSQLFTDSATIQNFKDSIVLIPKYAIINYKNIYGLQQVDSHALKWHNQNSAIGMDYLKDIINAFYYSIEIDETKIQLELPYYRNNIETNEYYRYDSAGAPIKLSAYNIKYHNEIIDTIIDSNTDGPIKYKYYNNLLREIDYLDAFCNSTASTKYTYNQGGQIEEKKNIYPEEDYIYTEKFGYDNNGLLIFRSFEESDLNGGNVYITHQDSFKYKNSHLSEIIRYADLGNDILEYLFSKKITYNANGNITNIRSQYIGDYFAASTFLYYNNMLVETYTYEGSSTDSTKTLGKIFGYESGKLISVETSRFQNGRYEKTGLEEVFFTDNYVPKFYKYSTKYDATLGAWVPGQYDRNIEIFYDEKIVQVKSDGINPIANVAKNDFSVYPNPANDLLYVRNATTETMLVNIIDVQGHNVITRKLMANSNLSINISDLSSGIYLVNFGNTGYYEKLIVD